MKDFGIAYKIKEEKPDDFKVYTFESPILPDTSMNSFRTNFDKLLILLIELKIFPISIRISNVVA